MEPADPGGSRQWNSCNTLPHCLGAVGSATPAMHCHTAWGHWAVELQSCAATLLRGSGQRAAQLLQCTVSLPGGSGQCNPCNTLPHHGGAVGSATSAVHCHAARGLTALCRVHMEGGGGGGGHSTGGTGGMAQGLGGGDYRGPRRWGVTDPHTRSMQWHSAPNKRWNFVTAILTCDDNKWGEGCRAGR